MASGQDVYCTLVMSDNYLPGAAVLAHSLRDAGTQKKLAVMVTLDTLRASTVTELESLYDHVIPVDRIGNPNPSNLYLMNRADLMFAFTKINLWRLTQFRKIVYVDADVVALRAPDELFSIDAPFAAAPDVGWPDAFNSGVMALTPQMGDYWALQTLSASGDSFDGADQGLLNQYYEHKSWHRLSFKYNCTPSANYQYEPAYRYHKSNISMVHFIGKSKPWLEGRSSQGVPGAYNELLARWWAVYDRHFKAPASNAVRSLVKGEPRSPLPESEAAITTSEPLLTDSGEPTEDLSQATEDSSQAIAEPAPAPEHHDFSAPHMDWDATRGPPPADARPEAANFPTQLYAFNHDNHLFRPPGSYPEPPKDMWYEVPKDKPLPPKAKLNPIFPWEERSSTAPTRVFAEDVRSPETETAPPLFSDLSNADSSPSESAPKIKITSDDPWNAFESKNAWDQVSGIDDYVRHLTQVQRTRGNVQVLSTTGESPGASSGPQIEVAGGRRESMILTDFPSAMERPSLPVTPAPVRRPTFWGEERNEEGALPAAEGVPHQAEWNPEASLEQLRRNSLIEVSELKMPTGKIPKRDMPSSSAPLASISESTQAQPTAPQNTSAAPAPTTTSAPSSRPSFGAVDFAAAAPEKLEDVLSPTEHGSRQFH